MKRVVRVDSARSTYYCLLLLITTLPLTTLPDALILSIQQFDSRLSNNSYLLSPAFIFSPSLSLSLPLSHPLLSSFIPLSVSLESFSLRLSYLPSPTIPISTCPYYLCCTQLYLSHPHHTLIEDATFACLPTCLLTVCAINNITAARKPAWWKKKNIKKKL